MEPPADLPSRDAARGRAVAGRMWFKRAFLGCTAAVLLWALYDYGAFLRPSKLVAAIVFPALGLAWGVWGLHRTLRHGHSRRVEERQPAPSLPQPSLAEWLLLALGLLGALSAAWSIDWAASLRADGILLGGLLFLRLGRDLGNGSPSRALGRWGRPAALLLLTIVGVVESLLAVVGYALRYWRFAMEQDGALTATGTFGYANALAGLLLLTLAATAALYLETRTWPRVRARSKAIAVVVTLQLAAALQVVALVLTGSRAALAALVALLVVFAVVRAFTAAGNARYRCLGIALSLLLVCGVVVAGVLVWREVAPQLAVSGLPPSGSDPADVVPMTSNAFRLKTWTAALEAARERPILGYGLGTFYEAYSPFKLGGHTAYAHNVVIQHLVEVGALGALLLLAFLAAALIRPLKTLVAPIGEPRIPLLLGALAFALHNLVDLTWYFPALFYTFALVVGLSSRPPQTAPPTEPPTT